MRKVTLSECLEAFKTIELYQLQKKAEIIEKKTSIIDWLTKYNGKLSTRLKLGLEDYNKLEEEIYIEDVVIENCICRDTGKKTIEEFKLLMKEYLLEKDKNN